MVVNKGDYFGFIVLVHGSSWVDDTLIRSIGTEVVQVDGVLAQILDLLVKF